MCAWKKEKAEALAQSKLSDKKSARKGMISDCNPFNPRLEGATRLLALLISSLASNLRNSRKKEKKKGGKKEVGGDLMHTPLWAFIKLPSPKPHADSTDPAVEVLCHSLPGIVTWVTVSSP